MLANIQSTQFLVAGNAKSNRVFDAQENQSHAQQHESHDRKDAQGLNAQLTGAVAIENPAVRGEQSDRKRSPDSVESVNGTGSSICIRSSSSVPKTTSTPPVAPMTTAAHGSTDAQGAVMATSPARHPFIVIPRSGFPARIQIVAIPVKAPAAAARFVFIATFASNEPSPTPNVDPGLNPNQPNQRINTPSEASGILCPRMARAFPLTNLPIRGPRRIVPIKAAHPPVA